jgi:alkylation response protein AidB-like acyl-CoA dehydrogenase
MTDDNVTTDAGNVTYEGHRVGREALEAWAEARPDNAYTTDSHFQRILPIYTWKKRHASLDDELTSFGAEVAGPIDELARQNDLRGNHPTLDRYTAYGSRTEKIDHHPSYHRAGELIYGSGVMEAYADPPNSVGATARMYVSSYNGEAGHNCPLACTAGAIRVLQQLADEELKERYLPGLLNPTYGEHLEGAQFMTEVQGGSDVGTNATRAEPRADGRWEITGEKWFCSNIDADLFVMTARFDEGYEGTSGLGLFLVPRRLENGEPNGFEIRRLKDKIGTRAMASAECDFRGAIGWHLGPEERGFQNMMAHVINTSRLYNGIACTGVARRAYVTAKTYASYRQAFGQPIAEYPLIQETLAGMKAEIDAATSANMYLARLQDRIDEGETTDAEQQFFRMALNLNKVRTARLGRTASVRGIEVLGGNGAIETFSVLPRMLRDSIVTENWEGTHNTLQMQVMRDMQKYALHEGFFAHLETLLAQARPGDESAADRIREALQTSQQQLAKLPNLDQDKATLVMKPEMDRLARAMHAAVRIWERSQHVEEAAEDAASLAHFIETSLHDSGRRGSDAYAKRIRTISRSL